MTEEERKKRRAATHHRYYLKNKAKIDAYGKKHGPRYSARWREKNRQRIKDKRLEKEFGITADRYGEMLVEQGGGCAICGSRPGAKRLCVDHDHRSGAVRGLLCANCNAGIGFLRDDPRVLVLAMEYLRKHRGA